MPKTYNTIPSVSTGDVYTATAHNNIVTSVNNYRVPPACTAYRSSDLTSYASAAITWQAVLFDTESPSDPMWASGSPTQITVRTAGLYLVTFSGYTTATATVTLVVPRVYVGASIVAQQNSPVQSGTDSGFSFSTVLSCAVGNVITADVAYVGGSAYVIKGAASTTNQQTRLSVAWLGQVS